MTMTVGGYSQLGFDFEEPIAVQKGKVVVFDLETQKSFDEVGGRDRTRDLKMSVGVVYDFLSDSFRVYRERDAEAMVDDLFSAELVVGYNCISFDYNVLTAYTHRDFTTLRTMDMMCVVEKNLGFRVKLDNLVSCTIGSHKAGDGLQALEWYRCGEWEKLEYYCREDVRLTKELFEFGRQNRYVHYEDFNTGAMGKVPVDW